MKKLYTEEQFQKAKGKDLLSLECYYCKEEFLYSKKKILLFIRHPEDKRYSRCEFCSEKCKNASKREKSLISLKCCECKKEFIRKKSNITCKNNFCSHSCSASFSNRERDGEKFGEQISQILRKKFGSVRYKECAGCSKIMDRKLDRSQTKYCSKKCYILKQFGPKITLQEAETIIKDFFVEFGRIPLKREIDSKLVRYATKEHKSWNKFIEFLGYTSNKEAVYKSKIKCEDGHLCDSVSEKIICDFLNKNGVEHEIHKRYPNSKFISDFYIPSKRIYVEFFGLAGNKKYDYSIIKKRKFAEESEMKVIEIFPKDLFPNNKLKEIFKELTKDI